MWTKAALHYVLDMPGQGTSEIRLRLSEGSDPDREGPDPTRTVDGCFGSPFEGLLSQRRSEAEEFYNALVPEHILGDGRQVVRQAAAGLLWTKQFFHHVVKDWLEGDPTQPAPPPGRSDGRNRDWPHVYNRDVISMPDKWGRRPCHGSDLRYADDPHWRDLSLFDEYFHAETGRGCGASHQTGWSALAARFIDDWARPT